ncbi:MAG: four helix bundle protein [Bacteroidales bacterium]|nr:four helix bundle protein [Bacteroidales bacterium]
MENRSFNFFRFEDLRVYHKALDFSRFVNGMLKSIPGDDVLDQTKLAFSKSALNISVNIAEGSGRNKSQFIYYLKMAKSSIRECVVYSTSLLNEGYISQEKFDESKQYLIELSKMVGALITSLQRGPRRNYEPQTDADEEEDLPNLSEHNT